LPAAAGGGQENPLARGQKFSSPKTPPFFAHSPLVKFFKFNVLTFYPKRAKIKLIKI